MTGQSRRRRPFATLQQADAERDGQAVEPGKIGGISRNDAPPLVDLQHHFVDDAGQRAQPCRIAVRAPVQQSGDPQPIGGRQMRAQRPKEGGVAGQVARARVEVDLHPHHAIARPAPAIERGEQLRMDMRRPVERFHAHHHPQPRVADMRHGGALRHQPRGVAADDGAVQQVDLLGTVERGLRADAGPQPEGVIARRIDPRGGRRRRRGGRDQGQRQQRGPCPTSNSAAPWPSATTDNRASTARTSPGAPTARRPSRRMRCCRRARSN